MSAIHNWSTPVSVRLRARFGYTFRPWLESVVMTNFRFRTPSRLSSRIRRRTRASHPPPTRAAATRASYAGVRTMRSMLSPGRPSLLLGPSRRRRISSPCLQHPLLVDALQATLQKIDLQGLLADLAFQLRDPAIRPALLPVTRKRVAWPLTELTPPAVQHVGIHLQRSRGFRDRHPLLQAPHRGQLELLGERPSRQAHDSIFLSMDFES